LRICHHIQFEEPCTLDAATAVPKCGLIRSLSEERKLKFGPDAKSLLSVIKGRYCWSLSN